MSEKRTLDRHVFLRNILKNVRFRKCLSPKLMSSKTGFLSKGRLFWRFFTLRYGKNAGKNSKKGTGQTCLSQKSLEKRPFRVKIWDLSPILTKKSLIWQNGTIWPMLFEDFFSLCTAKMGCFLQKLKFYIMFFFQKSPIFTIVFFEDFFSYYGIKPGFFSNCPQKW